MTLRSLLVIVALSVVAPACTPGAAATLARVTSVVNDASQVLTLADLAYREYARLANPPVEQQQRFESLLATAWRALNLAANATRGAEALSQQDYDAAFQGFRAAYAELHAYLVELGVTGAPGALGAAAGRTALPEPAALTFRVDQ